MDPKDSLELYELKHLLYYVAVEMVIDRTEKIAHVITNRLDPDSLKPFLTDTFLQNLNNEDYPPALLHSGIGSGRHGRYPAFGSWGAWVR